MNLHLINNKQLSLILSFFIVFCCIYLNAQENPDPEGKGFDFNMSYIIHIGALQSAIIMGKIIWGQDYFFQITIISQQKK
jgi:hypothetical protein